jgi:hypothetical protein
MPDVKPSSNSNHSIAQALILTQNRIAAACDKAGRPHSQVSLLAVSKTKPLEDIMQAYNQGQRQFGENYLQDALAKIKACPFNDIEWHFIGAIQSNKTKAIAEHFDWVHTLDRLKIARRLSEQRPDHLAPLKVLIQVNISQEVNKSGIMLSQLDELVAQVDLLPHLQLCGLMCIPAATEEQVQQEHAFTQMTQARDRLKPSYPQLTELSMGMSGDLASAIACGATMVRIGTDIFGARTINPPCPTH